MLDLGYADFRECDTGEVPRIPLLGSRVNKGKSTEGQSPDMEHHPGSSYPPPSSLKSSIKALCGVVSSCFSELQAASR